MPACTQHFRRVLTARRNPSRQFLLAPFCLRGLGDGPCLVKVRDTRDDCTITDPDMRDTHMVKDPNGTYMAGQEHARSKQDVHSRLALEAPGPLRTACDGRWA